MQPQITAADAEHLAAKITDLLEQAACSLDEALTDTVWLMRALEQGDFVRFGSDLERKTRALRHDLAPETAATGFDLGRLQNDAYELRTLIALARAET